MNSDPENLLVIDESRMSEILAEENVIPEEIGTTKENSSTTKTIANDRADNHEDKENRTAQMISTKPSSSRSSMSKDKSRSKSSTTHDKKKHGESKKSSNTPSTSTPSTSKETGKDHASKSSESHHGEKRRDESSQSSAKNRKFGFQLSKLKNFRAKQLNVCLRCVCVTFYSSALARFELYLVLDARNFCRRQFDVVKTNHTYQFRPYQIAVW